MCHVLKTQAFAMLRISLAWIFYPIAECHGNPLHRKRCKGDCQGALKVYLQGGVAGLARTVSDHGKAPRDVCFTWTLRCNISRGTMHTRTVPDGWSTLRPQLAGRTWLLPSGCRPLANNPSFVQWSL